MEKERRQLLTLVRNHLFNHPSEKINLLEICEAIDQPLNKLTQIAPNPESLFQQMLELKYMELEEVLDIDKYQQETAIDSMVISGQDIYERFGQLSPVNYLFINESMPDLYLKWQDKTIELIHTHLLQNLEKGIKTGEYKTDLNKNAIVEKYIQRIIQLHTNEYLLSENFSFASVFSDIFEDFLAEVATEENWHYFRKRKQFYEAISFINR